MGDAVVWMVAEQLRQARSFRPRVCPGYSGSRDSPSHFTTEISVGTISWQVAGRRQPSSQSLAEFYCRECLSGFCALYELIECAVAIVSGSGADDFLGTQGYVWDTQTDMAMALIGALAAVLFMSGIHDRSLQKLAGREAG